VLAAQGKSDTDAGVLLGISNQTVHQHIETAKRRYGVATRTNWSSAPSSTASHLPGCDFAIGGSDRINAPLPPDTCGTRRRKDTARPRVSFPRGETDSAGSIRNCEKTPAEEQAGSAVLQEHPPNISAP